MIGSAAIGRASSLGFAALAPLPAPLAHLLALLRGHALEEGAALLGSHVAQALAARAEAAAAAPAGWRSRRRRTRLRDGGLGPRRSRGRRLLRRRVRPCGGRRRDRLGTVLLRPFAAAAAPAPPAA